MDIFLGSGTTAIAAHKEGFNFIGIEKEKEYYEVALKRFEYWKVNDHAMTEQNKDIADKKQMDLF